MRERPCEALAMERVRGLVELQRWRMVCDVDVDVDVGRRMVFGSEERREQMEK